MATTAVLMRSPLGGLLVTILLLVSATPASAEQGPRAIELTRPADIAAAASVDRALSALVQEAAACKSPGRACACGLKAGLNRLSAAYRGAMRTHANWKESTVQYVRQVDGRAITTAVVFPALRRQLDMCHVP